MDINQETLAKITKELMFTEPFYGMLLLPLNKKWSKGIKTARITYTGINFDLTINPDFWAKLSPEHRKGLLKHELMHLAFFHLTDYDHLVDRKIANYAMDIEINQYIDPKWLPKGGLGLHSFPELKLKPRMGTKYYYDKLQTLSDEIKNLLRNALGNGDGSVTLPDGSIIDLTDHDWEEIDKLDEGSLKVMRDQLGGILKTTADNLLKSTGTLPGEMHNIIDALTNIPEPKFDWIGYIRRFAGKSIKVYTKKSRRKFSKRYEDNPGLKIKQKKHILVAIDTSGSVSIDELKEFLQEIHHLHKTGNEITIIQCDTAISHVGSYKPGEDYKVHGRGGTSFQPVIDYYNEHMKKISCLIYFTDGEAMPPVNPQGNILWVLSNRSNMNEDLPGSVIKLDI
jgi:predicted metal-dependent peptidase